MDYCQEDYLSGDVTVGLVLTRRYRGCDEEQYEPRDADLIEHLQIQNANARVKFGAHEEVIDGIAGKSMAPATDHCLNIHDDAVYETGQYCDSHDGTELIDESVQGKYAGGVQSGGDC